MYYVPDGTERCGYYECEDCHTRFLDLQIAPTMVCPYCGEEIDMEIGPDDEITEPKESAKLIVGRRRRGKNGYPSQSGNYRWRL